VIPTDSYGRPQRPSSLVPRQPSPPIQHSWSRIQAWLAREYPELGDTLNYGILPEDLEQAEMSFGFTLPHAVRESYLQVDGQERESSAGCTEGLFFGLSLLPLEDVLDEWRFWREVDEDPATGANPKLKERMKSIPTGWVRREYSCRGWVPLITDRVGNYIGVDLSPGEGGVAGQVIVFGREFDTKVVLWRGDGEGGWARFLAAFAEELETGETFEVGPTDRDSDGSEDSIGDEPYFFDGSAHGKRGDGGGERGVVGMCLHGEYKGWPAMEALADRSVKRWKDVGLLKDSDCEHRHTR
jgi:cell wall assembly regulator SMI1